MDIFSFVPIKNLAYIIDAVITYSHKFSNFLFENEVVNLFLKIVLIIGGFLYVAGIGLAFANFSLETREDVNKSVVNTIKNCFIGFACYLSYTTIPISLLVFTNLLCSELSFITTKFSFVKALLNYTPPADISAYFQTFANGLKASSITPIYMIIMFVCVARVFFAQIKRGGILMSLMFIGSFHLFSIPRGYTDSFWSWCKQVVGVCTTAFLQEFLLSLSIQIFAVGGTSSVVSAIASLGVALASGEVPRILQQFGLDTSMKANVSQAIFATSGITNIVSAFVRGTRVNTGNT